ncbi:lamin tail domain-containing protein [Arenimonas sp. MALMAid1274]|uniref:lamin tail domain-containing protein n=1 Tax=Arenimonas sp. MALMAid1274 TaxID=3411630 RepID=UPI003B9FF5BA
MRHPRLLALLACSLLAASASSVSAQVVISQAYGGGGNAGAPFTHDFVELFNRGTQDVSLGGKSLQYASATGNFTNIAVLPTATLQPGQYFLVQLASGANGVALPVSPDATGGLNLAGASGKIAFVNGITALGCGGTTACTTPQLELFLDRVSFGTAGFGEGGVSAPVLSNSTAALRAGAGCTDTDNNGSDFTAVTPAPRNSGSTFNPCGGGTDPEPPEGSGSASPASLAVGDNTLLTVAVVAGINPASTGITVQADLSAIGGSATQAFFDDGSNGDVTPGDLTFSYATPVAVGTGAGAKSLPFTVADAEARSSTGNIALSVVARVAIHDIQGAGRQSPLVNAEVITEGIVTAVRGSGFYLQSDPSEVDADPATSQGILVFTSAPPPAAAAVGNRVAVAGRVVEFTSGSNPNQLSLTEITAPSVSLVSTGNPLPPAVQIDATQANAASPVDNLERYEGMRVAIASLTTTAGDEGLIDENDATSTADGDFWGVVTGVARPFREPGIGVLDVTPIPGGKSPPRFDTNPERIRVQSTGQVGAPVIAVDAGATITGLEGVLDYGFGAYTLYPDPGASVVVTGGVLPTAVSDALPDEVTIAGFNLLRFYDDVNDAGGDVALTTLAFERRLRKTADAICTYVRTPDILGVVEVENLNALNRLAQAINSNIPGSCTRNPQYVAYLEEGNDVGKINIGYLVSTAEVRAGVPRVVVQEVVQYGKAEVDTNPNGSTSLMHDRPPLLLRAEVNAANGGVYPVTVIGNHLRSLNGVNSTDPGSNGWSTDGARIRAKRASQARYTAQLVQDRQTQFPDEHLVLLGDFNAFEYSDGYADVMGIITGREAAEPEVLNYVDSPVTTPLTNMTTLSAAADRYSYVFEGNLQTLDHIVVNQALLDDVPGARTEHARINAEFGGDNYGDDSVAIRVSDHDPVVLYLPADALRSADLSVDAQAPASPVRAGDPLPLNVVLANAGPSAALDVIVRLTVGAEAADITLVAPAGFTCVAGAAGELSQAYDCAADDVAVGDAEFGITVATTAAEAGRSVTLSAQVESATADPSAANNSDSVTSELAGPEADLVLAWVDGPGAVTSRRNFTLGMDVRNNGAEAAASPRVALTLVASKTKFSPEPPTGWTCELTGEEGFTVRFLCSYDGEFAAGRSDRLQFNVRPSTSTLITAGAAVSSSTGDPDPDNNDDALVVLVMYRSTQ